MPGYSYKATETYNSNIDEASNSEAVAPVVNLLAELADGAKVLEFGIGTSRIALQLALTTMGESGGQ